LSSRRQHFGEDDRIDRLAAVQVVYKGGEFRDLVIVSRRPKANASARTAGRWYCQSFFTPSDWMERDAREVPMVWGDLSGLDGLEVAQCYLEGLSREQIEWMLDRGHEIP
jgi:hypothetical protein